MSIAKLGVDRGRYKSFRSENQSSKKKRYLLNVFVFGTKLVSFVNHASKSKT